MGFDLIKFKKLVEKKSGIQITDNEKLRFAVEEMMTACEVDSEKALFNLVDKKQAAFEDFVGFLTINETYFFRESSQIDVFSNELIPSILRAHKKKTINILSAGCSTGAEPYSLVIALMEKYGFHIRHLFSVKGFDIDKKALMIAEKGIYGKYYFRGLDTRLIEKYFDKIDGEKYQIKSFVKDMVDFYPHNLLHRPLSDLFSERHVIFYRNVAIYFSQENQKKIFINLADMLCKNGWLIMSSTETLPHDFQILSLTKVKDIFVYQKKDPDLTPENGGLPAIKKTVSKPFTRHRLTIETPKSPPPETSVPDRQETLDPVFESREVVPEVQVDTAWAYASNKQYSEALAAIETLTDKPSAPARAYTIKAGILMNLNKLAEAKKACHKALNVDEFSLDGFLLLGIIAKLESDLETSEEKLKKTIYLDPSCWLAHYYLAEIYGTRGETEKAIRKYEIVIKQLEKVKTTDTEVLFGAFTFSEKELIHACRNSVEKLKS